MEVKANIVKKNKGSKKRKHHHGTTKKEIFGRKHFNRRKAEYPTNDCNLSKQDLKDNKKGNKA